MEWFKIDWKGPYSLETALSRAGDEGLGIYAIYEIQGKEIKLLYFGETRWRDFEKHLQQQRREWLVTLDVKASVSFGIPIVPEGQAVSRDRLSQVEGTLIQYFRPPYNTLSKKAYAAKNVLIFNTGKTGPLDPIVCDNRELLALLQKSIGKR